VTLAIRYRLLLIMLVAALLYSALLFLPIFHSSSGYFSTDGGTYLHSRDAVLRGLGIEAWDRAMVRPPLAPGWALVPFMPFGDDVGLRLWSILGIVLTIPAAYYFSRSILTPNQSFVVAALTGFDVWIIHGFVAGALVLYAWCLLAVALRPVVDWAHGVSDKRRTAFMAAALALLPFVNQTFAGLCVIVFAVAMPIALFARYRQGLPIVRQPMWIGLVVGGAIGVLALPWYLGVAPGSETARYDYPWLELTARTIYASAITMVVVLLVPRGGYGVRMMQALLVVLGVMLMLFSGDEAISNLFYRAVFVSAMLYMPLIVYVAGLLGAGRKVAVLAICVFAASSVVWVSVNTQDMDHTPDEIVHAIKWMEDRTDPDDFVIADSWHLSRWVEGSAEVKSMTIWHGTSGSPRRHQQMSNDAICIVGWGDCDLTDAYGRWQPRFFLSHTGFSDLVWIDEESMILGLSHLELLALTDELPYTRLVFSEGVARVWELDTEYLAKVPSAQSH
jgi:hypothetical protein